MSQIHGGSIVLTANSGKASAAELTGTFDFGIGYAYFGSAAHNGIEAHTQSDNTTSDCDYFTFVPFNPSSCGVLIISPCKEVAFVGGYDNAMHYWQSGQHGKLSLLTVIMHGQRRATRASRLGSSQS